MLLRALLDNGKFIWFDAMNNLGDSGDDIFDMALSYEGLERDYVVQVSRSACWFAEPCL